MSTDKELGANSQELVGSDESSDLRTVLDSTLQLMQISASLSELMGPPRVLEDRTRVLQDRVQMLEDWQRAQEALSAALLEPWRPSRMLACIYSPAFSDPSFFEK